MSSADEVIVITRKPAKPRKETKRDEETKHIPLYHVVLLDDNDHTYEYVIEMLGRLFGYPREKAFLLALEVDLTGRAILLTTTKEHAELKQEQIHAYGPDPRIPRCAGSMTCVIEPAE